jgi:large subunit ribosomal protein L33
MVVKKKATRKVARPIIRLICEKCKVNTYSTRKNPKNTTERLALEKFCKICKAKTVHKETK